ncbi:restriction endonuclease subunit S [uncultured Microscilla sp.]|uniref:restriction endonuclease subunit S n=1 Tax=uncultured Microscilla sp. TaxID=432653 RepID=UPI0026100713|nr:restriction endonuclease subunit S [uncultured Microscilla sp.]
MSNFVLSDQVNQEKVFLLRYSQVIGRLDPVYYQSVDNLPLVKQTVYPVYKLSNVITMQRGRFGHRPRNDPAFYGGKYPFIQTGDIVKASQSDGKIVYSQTLNEKGVNTSRLFQPNVLVMTIAANIGDTAILDYPACFPDSLIALYPKDERLNINYLNIYFKFIKPYLEKLAPQSAQKNINIQQLSPMPIIVPPEDRQRQICLKYDKAVQIKQQKLVQAQQLLAGINHYLLKELGIVLPKKDTSLQSRIFTVPIRAVSGERFDPKRYDKNVKDLKRAIEGNRFDSTKLKTLIVSSRAGDWGKDDNTNLGNEYCRCLVVRATEFDNVYNLKLENNRVKHRLIQQKKLIDIDIRPNDLLIEKSGGSLDQPVGRVAILREELLTKEPICYSNFIHKIRVNSQKVLPEYLFCFLKTVHHIKLTDAMQSQTNGIRNLIMPDYLEQTIPLPHLAKQNEIVTYIQDLRDRAKQLQAEANQALVQAKQEIEQMILGDNMQ